MSELKLNVRTAWEFPPQSRVVLASDYDALSQRCRELEDYIDNHSAVTADYIARLQRTRDERDTLRAEVERLNIHVVKAQQHALTMGNKALELAAREIELQVEVEQLRKDAERYRALRRSLGGAPGCASADMPLVHVPLRTDLTYSPEGLDRAIDAAMRNEQ